MPTIILWMSGYYSSGNSHEIVWATKIRIGHISAECFRFWATYARWTIIGGHPTMQESIRIMETHTYLLT
jgi:hypothetical protein